VTTPGAFLAESLGAVELLLFENRIAGFDAGDRRRIRNEMRATTPPPAVGAAPGQASSWRSHPLHGLRKSASRD
jgi:hypothetical protein